jgi:hypothetical protein
MMVTIDAGWEPLIQKRAEAIVASYKSGKSERSRLTGMPNRQIWGDVKKQAVGIRAEVVFSLWLGIDPSKMLNRRNGADPGFDVNLSPLFVDVKSTFRTDAQFLIWPTSKNHFFDEVRANIFVMVRPSVKALSFDILGWTTKGYFADHHETPGPNGPRLDSETRFMRAANLWPAAALRAVIFEISKPSHLAAA